MIDMLFEAARRALKAAQFKLRPKHKQKWMVEEKWAGADMQWQQCGPLMDEANAFFLHYMKPRKYVGLLVRVTRVY